MISSHQHHLMRILFPYSKTEVPGNTIQVFQQHINQKCRAIRKWEMQLTFIYIPFQTETSPSLDSLLKWLVDVQKICYPILALQLGFQAGIMWKGPSEHNEGPRDTVRIMWAGTLPCSKEEGAGRVSCHSILSTSWSISVIWVKDKEGSRQRKWRHFCPAARDNLWAECWHAQGTEPPRVHCVPASTPAGSRTCKTPFICLLPQFEKPASLPVKALFPDLAKKITIHDLKIYLCS